MRMAPLRTFFMTFPLLIDALLDSSELICRDSRSAAHLLNYNQNIMIIVAFLQLKITFLGVSISIAGACLELLSLAKYMCYKSIAYKDLLP